VPGPFHPLNITGEKAGQKNCLVCQNGDHPVAMIFAREANEPVMALIKKIDACTAKHQDSDMGSFAVFLSEDEDLPKQLKELAQKDHIKHTVLAVDSPTGPQAYKIAKDADVTVVLYTHRTVKANYAFPKGDLNEKAISRVVADVGKILPRE
jgi:isopentenyl diphosphate isomerase/L-lactate dehydrogenase-like FMN-dependent dehydrogenase